MVNIVSKYNGRTIRESYFSIVQDEFQELDDYYMYKFSFSATMEAIIYMDKEKYIVQGVKVIKTTPGGRWNILTDISDSAAKALDQRMNLLLGEVIK